jgi:hypothetical protein
MPKGLTLWLRVALIAVVAVLGLIGYDIVNHYKGPFGGIVGAFIEGSQKRTGESIPPSARAQMPMHKQFPMQVHPDVQPAAAPGPVSSALSLSDAAQLVLMLALTGMFAWVILELRRRLDETAGVAPAILDIQRRLGDGSIIEKSLRDGSFRVLDFVAELRDRLAQIERRLDAVEGVAGRNSAASEYGSDQSRPSPQQQARVEPRPAAAGRRLQIEKEYLHLLVDQLPDEFRRFAEYRRVRAAKKTLNGEIYISGGSPEDALHWVVEDDECGTGLLFPGQMTIARLGSLMTDGGSGLRQSLGFAFNIESGSQADFVAARLQSGGGTDAPLVVYARGSITLPWKG